MNHANFDEDLAEEMRQDRDVQVQENAASVTDSERAGLEARRQFGNSTPLKDRSNEGWNWIWVQTIGQDLRYGMRKLAAAPTFTLASLVSLAIGIGANTAVFSLLNAVLLRALPVEHPQALVRVAAKQNSVFTYPMWERIRDRQGLFAGALAFGGARFNLADSGEAHYARGLWVSGDYFRVLGVAPVRGRIIEPTDDTPGCGAAGPVAVVSYEFWKNRLSSGRTVIGSTLKLERHPFQVIGVAPRWFTGLDLDQGFDVAVPMGCEPIVNTDHSRLKDPNSWWLRIVGRLNSGQTIEQASAQLAAAEPDIYGASASNTEEYKRQERTLRVESAATGFSSTATRYRTALFALAAAVVLVLLIACANIANLLIARAAIRQREFSVRLAIGASRARVARQLLTESVLLSLVGAAAGAVLSFWGSRLLVRLLSTAQERIDLNVSPDARVLVFTAGVAIITGLLFGMAPAWRGATSGVAAALRENSRGGMSGGSRFRLGKALVAIQVALSLVLLTGAVAFSGSLRNLLTHDPGFDRQNVILVRASASPGRVPLAQLTGMFGNMLESVRRLPQARSASASVLTPVGDMYWTGDVYPEGYNRKSREDALLYFNRVTPGYFQTLRTRLLVGRDFTDRDNVSAPGVIIISRSAARKFWGDADPIGKVIRTDRLGRPGEFDSFQVVGIVADIKYGRLDEQPVMTGYYPLAQEREPFATTVLEIRSGVPIEALVPEIRSIAAQNLKNMTLEFRTLDEQVKDSLVQARLLALISGFFGFVAILLAVTGLYGVIGYTTARRRSEIGIRVALGAEFASVVWLVLRDAGIMVAAGVLAGIAASLAAGRLVQSLVYNIKPSDPAVLAATAAILTIAAAVAAWLPARRAARMDPMSALRDE